MHATRYGFPLEAAARYSVARGQEFRIGLEFPESTRLMTQGVAVDTDYYEAQALVPAAPTLMSASWLVRPLPAARIHVHRFTTKRSGASTTRSSGL
jgi:hypothetical protein